MEQLSSEGLPTVKRMSDTRWSARADATKALVEGYDEINDALVEIAGNEEEKAETREEGPWTCSQNETNSKPAF